MIDRRALALLLLTWSAWGCVEDASSTDDPEPQADASVGEGEGDASPGGAGGTGGEVTGGMGGEVGGAGGLGGMPAPDAEVPDAEPLVEASGPGEPCVDDDDCAEGTCLTGPEWPEGYCAVEGCLETGCPDGAVCIEEAEGSFCAQSCGPEDCRFGYACADADGRPVCLPGDENDGRIDGLPCNDDRQCAGGACIEDWPGGFCTTVGCQNRMDCARGPDESVDNRCFVSNDPQFCVRICGAPSDCRQGYICQPFGQGIGVCFPNPNEPLLSPEEIEDQPVDITCVEPDDGVRFDLPFTVEDDTSAYMVVPFSEDGTQVDPRGIALPSGEVINFRGGNAFQRATAQLFGTVSPTVVPATRAYADQLESGEHTFIINSNSARMCYYTLQESSPGTRIDFNVYLVGIGRTADNAPNDPDMQAVFAQFESVYAPAGIEIGEIRYIDVVGEDAQRFQVIRSQGDVGEVLKLTELPGDTLDDALSLNLVFIRSFALPGGGGVLGISQGLPGPAGLHGAQTSGVVFTGEFIGSRFQERGGQVVDGNVFTGNVLAHEVGHYIGLFHTTEQNQQTTDPLADTPDCRNAGFPNDCPDRNNLMFPLAGADNSIVTEDQASVIQANPLTKE
ncbi:MAG: hypothetical protein ACE366_22995 [Bradymonadia bacterium]